MKKNKGNTSPFILVLIPVMLGLLYLASTTRIEIPTEKYSASIHFQMPSYQTLVKGVVALFNW
jgi:hypothetical protein